MFSDIVRSWYSSEMWSPYHIWTWQQNWAPSHTARNTINFLHQKNITFIEPDMWQANSPDLNQSIIPCGELCKKKFTLAKLDHRWSAEVGNNLGMETFFAAFFLQKHKRMAPTFGKSCQKPGETHWTWCLIINLCLAYKCKLKNRFVQ